MGLSRNPLITFASLAVVAGAVAVVGFDVPLGALLPIALLFGFPLMMMGMHRGGMHRGGMHGGGTHRGGGHQHDSSPTSSTPPDHGTHHCG